MNTKVGIFKFPGRMISASKTAPEGHVCVWNANIIQEDGKKVWFGDLDLTNDSEALQQYADQLGTKIFILKERDARFLPEGQSPDLSQALICYIPSFEE